MPELKIQRHEPAPLSVQVVQAETEVMLHRRRVAARVSTIGQELRTQLTSPAMFLVAGGLGFAAGIFTRPRAAIPERRNPPGIRVHPGDPPRKPFAMLLGLLNVVRSLENILPSSPPGATNQSANGTTIKPF